MKLGELRDAIANVMDADAPIPLREDAEVVVDTGTHWLRAETLIATFLRGRWALVVRMSDPDGPMWADESAASKEDGRAE